MPSSPPSLKREAAIQKISPSYYEILEQASSAEHHGLTLIAGAGYRKALEYLVKSYVVRDLRARLSLEANDEQPQKARQTEGEIATILELAWPMTWRPTPTPARAPQYTIHSGLAVGWSTGAQAFPLL
jgi:hypothetical protein